MVSSLTRHAPRDLERELAQAYDGEIPPPFYWQLPAEPRHAQPRHHPGEVDTAFPYVAAALPPELQVARAVSIEEVDEAIERRARREEVGG